MEAPLSVFRSFGRRIRRPGSPSPRPGFGSRGWTTSRRCSTHVVNALPKESLRTVLDLITEPPEDDPYQQLKDRLCQSHQLRACNVHRVHRVVTPFWRTFSHEGQRPAGEGGGARPPPFITFTITSKVAVYTLAEWADTLTLFHL